MTAPLADQAARDRIEHSLDETLVVEAAAGTGKTTELVRRIVRILAEGRADVTSIVAVTFTEKAAGELKLRLRQELEEARGMAATRPVRHRLEEALQNLEEAHVSTIHGFCAELLRERPVEASIDPLFTVLTDPQSQRCYEEAFGAWFQDVLRDAPQGVRRSLRRTSRPAAGERDGDGPVDRLRRAGWELAGWRDFPAPWSRPPFDRDGAVQRVAAQVQAFAALTAAPASARDGLCVDTAAARRAAADLRALLDGGDYDGAESVLIDLRRDWDFRRARKGFGSAYGKTVVRADVHNAHAALIGALDAFAVEADADLAALLREELRGSLDRYRELKARNGALDFVDLLLTARDLVRDNGPVRLAFQRRFCRIFVDEFQDTDPLQAEIIMLLAADDPDEHDWRRVRPVTGKLFIVGDPKQSIYRFRRADVSVYQDVCAQLREHGVEPIELTASFRSVPGIQGVVNAAFQARMQENQDTLQARYVPLTGVRSALGDQPSVVVLPVPRPYGKKRIAGAEIERSLPDAVGAFIDWILHESGWRVTERDGRQVSEVSIESRHICILFRRFVNYTTDMTRGYVDALEARGIPHLLVGGRAFHNREEIETLRAALAAIEWPDDELSVFATLRGSLFAIGDEELLEYHHQFGRTFHPFRIPEALPPHLEPIAEALRLLAALHDTRNHLPVADTITRLLDATRAHVGFALRRAGEQVLANVLHVAELARQYDLSGGISFRGFVEHLREAAEESQAAEAPIVEEGSGGVRLMTVHKAKGLEFPVVILADITANLAPSEASRHIDAERGLCALRIGGWSPHDLIAHQAIELEREREEGVRVAYVAATRARDLLVVPAVGDEEFDRWIGALNPAIYPPLPRRREQQAAPGCPPFRKDSVLERPGDEVARATTVCPGRHRFDGYDVVWWDPATLRLGADPPFGLRRQELISKDVSADVVAIGERRYLAWRQHRSEAIAAGKVPSMRVQTAREWAAVPTPEPDLIQVDVVALDRTGERPAGPRYGTLVHATIATVPLDAGGDVIAAMARTHGRIVGATDAEIESAVDVVGAVLAHPLVQRARDAYRNGRCVRETPIIAVMGDVLVEGVVDFAFDDGESTTVVDFKTDRELEGAMDTYRRQVQIYAHAIALATGRPARGVLMKI